jgi:hypothetical protein
MKTFKIIDVYIQMGLITGFAIASIINYDYTFLVGYFVIGGYQFISMLVHETGNWFMGKGTTRRYYHNITYILVACMALTPFVYVTGIVFFVLLFAAPFMAVYYASLCYKETYVYMKRPLSILK